MFTRLFGLVCLCALFGVLLVSAPPVCAAPRAVFTVTTTNDANDGVCDAAHCSLREAIIAANNSGAAGVINFDIIDFPPFVIQPTSPLPEITQNGINIDGYTQMGASPNTDPLISNAVILIELSGASAGFDDCGLLFGGGNGSVRGLAIYNWSFGVCLSSNANTVAGNFIGFSSSIVLAPGEVTMLPKGTGVYFDLGTTNNVIGGEIPQERNVISGNDCGICAAGSNHVIRNNLIGTSPDGTVALSNGDGISTSMTNSQIRDNVISGNDRYGIWLVSGARKNVVLRNMIGSDPMRTTAISNGWGGIALLSGAKTNRIGGAIADANYIENSGGNGITLDDTAGKANNLSGNIIHNNLGLGIDLGDDGVTPNDKRDPDGGPNLLQNYPLITSAESTPQRIRGKIKTTPNSTVTLDFYANLFCNASAFGEGQFYLGRLVVTTNGKGVAQFNWISTYVFFSGDSVTATATVKKNTSEFSACVIAVAG